MKLFTPSMIEKALAGAGGAADLRRAYSELRKIANKRLQRMEQQGLGSFGSYRFPKLSDLWDEDVPGALADVSRYLRDPRHTVRGEKKALDADIAKLHERGYDFIDRSNIYKFYDFMEEKRQEVGSKVFDSGAAADVFNEAQRLKIPPKVLKKNFDYFLENLDRMEKINPIKTNRAITFSDIKKKMERQKR